jgi:hypothetical protein
MVGQSVPLIRSVTTSEIGQTFNTQPAEEVGLILGVWPRISPDNVVVMEINAEKSEVAPEAEGIPISILATGEVIRTPRINRTSAQTTVSAADGQTVILGGLITKSKAQVSRKVPCLGDIPILGALFRYDAQIEKRTELLIILTPHVIRTVEDAEMIKQVEAARMSWCLCDVLELTDDPGLRGRTDEWLDSETHVVYPDLEPDAEMIPLPDGASGRRPMTPMPNGFPFVPQPEPPATPPEVPDPRASYRIYPAVPRPAPNDAAQRQPEARITAVVPNRRFTGAPNDAGQGQPAARQAHDQPWAYPAVAGQPTYQGVGVPTHYPYSEPNQSYQPPADQQPRPQTPWYR